MVSEAQKRANNKFNKENTTTVLLRLNKNTDKYIIDQLNKVESKMGYIKELIRKDMEEKAISKMLECSSIEELENLKDHEAIICPELYEKMKNKLEDTK